MLQKRFVGERVVGREVLLALGRASCLHCKCFGDISWGGPRSDLISVLPLAFVLLFLPPRATAQSPGKARWHWGAGCQTLSTASRSLGGVPWVQRGPSSAVRSPVQGSRGLRCGHVVWEDGCWRPRWGCLCWCSYCPSISCIALVVVLELRHSQTPRS